MQNKIQKPGIRYILIAALLILTVQCVCSTSDMESVAESIEETSTQEYTATPTDEPTATSEPTATDVDEVEPSETPTATPSSTSEVVESEDIEPSDTPEPAADESAAPSTIDGDQAVVTQIIDGDTIDVQLNGEIVRVRLTNIDTPERGEVCYGDASEALRDLIGGQTVTLVKDVSETDRYGRLLRYVYFGDTFINGEMVSGGWARVADYPPDVAHSAMLHQLEQAARQANLGCWPTGVFAEGGTAVATSEPAGEADVSPEPAPGGTGVVEITYVFYDGVVARVESDEYAVITNTGGVVVNLGGYRLNAGDPGQDFVFPAYDLPSGGTVRVYTNEVHPESGGFSFGSGNALWRNSGDCGHLYAPDGTEVSSYCY